MITKQQKNEIIKDLKDGLKNVSIAMFVNFHGLNVKMVSDLRRLLRQTGSKYFVTRKTLMKKALEGSNFAGEMPNLEGETAIVYSEGDPLSSASVLNNFIKKNKVLKILGGIFENQFIGTDKVVALASIPSREVLLAQMLYVINSPKRGLVVALSEIAKKKQA
ncbi:50S ribosomal protein L10 [Candidatus Parcubacteria bacterium]|nr:MAG: 50S ribosomal protein L10 [Candidatus Parcubacteria bacterium]